MTKKQTRLPNRIIVFPNKDKDGNVERWYENRNIANFPSPYRAVLIAKPGSGKTNLIKNVLVRAKPEFERIILVTQSKASREWDDVECEKYEDIPDYDSLIELDEETGKPIKSCLIMDDLELEGLSKDASSNLKKIMKHISSHFNLSVFITCHDLKQIPPSIRRQANIYFIFKISNETAKIFGQKMNIKNNEFFDLFNKNIKGPYDSLCIDLTVNSPYPLRKNLFEPITLEDASEDEENESQPKYIKFPAFSIKR